MKFSTLQAAVVALGAAAQPAVADLHGHRVAHQHYGKRSAHNHAAAHGPADAALLEHRSVAAAPSQPEARQPRHDSSPLPDLFTRAASPARDGEPKAPLKKRAVCSLPDHPDLVVVPGAQNGGWAMAPDVECTAGSWCPIACVSGKVMAQWKPGTTYTYPESMDGGLFCDESGTPTKAFSDQPYCVEGTGTVAAENRCGSIVSFCQTVLPGDEGMYIPTDVTGTAVLAVPGPSYWASTAAHYYVNPPGTAGKDGCVWGTESEPIGNWSPFVAGANTDASGLTFVKIAWNPMFTGSSSLSATKPTFGLRIECSDGGCNGLPCEIGADNMADFSVTSADAAAGAGGADFCVATVPKGGSATIVAFNLDGSSGSSSGSKSSKDKVASSSDKEATTTSPTTTSSSTTSTSTTSSTTSSSTSTSTTSTSSSTTSSSTTSSTTSSSSSSSSSTSVSSSVAPSSSSAATSSTSSSTESSTKTTTHRTPTKTKTSTTTTLAGGIFHENGTDSTPIASQSGQVTPPTTMAAAAAETAAAPSTSSKSEGAKPKQGGAAVVGLLIAVVAGLWLY